MRMLVIVPSRGRPQNAERLIEAFQNTVRETSLLFAVDRDDPELDGYLNLDHDAQVAVGDRLRMCPTLNLRAVESAWDYDAIGFMGDDHLPRTLGWDGHILNALSELGTGIVYGNDLIHGQALPTAVFMTADIVRALGWMCPPGLTHLWADNAWLALGQELGAIRYLPDVIIEHLHPIAQKAEWDAGYVECNDGALADADRFVFETWQREQLADDVAEIRAHVG